jgi:hypothetical protein
LCSVRAEQSITERKEKALNLMPVYAMMAVGSFSLLLIMSIFSGLGEIFDEGLDALFEMLDFDADDGGGTRWISSYSLIAFIGFAGIGGVMSQRYLGVTDEPSVVLALLSGLVGGGIIALFMNWMRRQERSTHLRSGSLVDREAHVSVAIPENGIGEVHIVSDESHWMSARSTDGGSIPLGTTVAIVKEGAPLIVRRKR